MNAVVPSQPQAAPAQPASPTPGGLGWFLSGFVLALGSRTFYRIALRKSPGLAVLFFFVFSTIVTLLTSIVVTKAFTQAGTQIDKAYREGSVPTITIRNGIAEVDGPQPRYIYDDPLPRGQGVIIAIDTTGKITSIDRARYAVGFLLTRTSLHMLNDDGRYQTLPLDQLNTMLSRDPLVIDARSITTAWAAMAGIMVFFVVLGVWFWHFVIGLMLTALLALIFWGLTALLRPGTQFGPVLTVGLYALVPAFYLAHLMTRSGIAFPGLQTLLLLPIWALSLFLGLSSSGASRQRPARLWTALIGLPLLAAMIVDVFVPFPSPWGLAALWGLFVITVAVLVGVRLLLGAREKEAAATVPAGPA